jgi:eukaryotic-like serine/threonine-protein kinase
VIRPHAVTDDDETVAARPSHQQIAATVKPAGLEPVTSPPSVSAREADAAAFDRTLRQAEVARTRQIVPFVMVLAFVGAALMPFAGGDRVGTAVGYAGIVLGLGSCISLYWLSRDEARFTERRLAVAYGVAITSVFAGVFYWGIFSPAAAIVALGIFFVTLGRSLRVGAGLYAWSALCQAALAVLVIGGVVTDTGLVATAATVQAQIIQQVMLQVVYLVTYLVARATRHQLDQAVGEHDRAVRAVAQREALLVEARQDLDHALKIGGPGRYSDHVVGSYRLGLVLGRGAMGDVYEAVHAETGEAAAVKLLNATALATPGQLARFYREAAAVVKLASPHIVRVREVSSAEGTVPYLAMERLVGRDLAHHLRERRRLPLGEAVALVQQVARGLEAARAAGIVHRDIKPQNLFFAHAIGGAQLWKILDFGVSKLGDHQGTLTKDQTVGTPMYMAPEQARGLAVDHRTDVFALGTVCYRAITGQPPYAGSDVPAILYGVVHRMPARPGELVKLPRDVDRAIAIALAKQPDDRFQTAIDFADALAAAAVGRLERALRDRADAALAARPWGAET